MPALNNFYTYLNQPLEKALNVLKKKKPSTSENCDELLKRLHKNEYETNSSEEVSEIKVPAPKNKSQAKLTSPNTRSLKSTGNIKPVSENNSNSFKKVEDKNSNNKLENGQKPLQNPNTKPNTQKTIIENEETTRQIVVEVTEDYVDDDSADSEYTDEIEDDLPEIRKDKSNVQTIKKENRNNFSESGSESYSEEET